MQISSLPSIQAAKHFTIRVLVFLLSASFPSGKRHYLLYSKGT
jgi:hypothetical protein